MTLNTGPNVANDEKTNPIKENLDIGKKIKQSA